MATKKDNIQRLADILASTAGIKDEKDPKQTIEKAIDVLKSNKTSKKIADEVEDGVESMINEEELYGSGVQSEIYNYLKMKFAGMPDVKSWAELQLTKQDLCNNAEEEYQWGDLEDNQYDIDNDITYDDIDQYLSTLDTDEYLDTVYEPDELKIVDDDDDLIDRELINTQCLLDQNYQDCKDYSDEQLKEALDYAENLSKSSDPEIMIEALTQAQRLRRAAKMRALSARLAIKRRITLSKPITIAKLKDRSRKLSIRMIKKRLAAGRSISKLSYGERANIEKRLKALKPVIDRLANKMFPVVRALQQKRLANKAKNKTVQSSKIVKPVPPKEVDEPKNVTKTPVVQKVSTKNDTNAQNLSGLKKI